MKIRGKVACPGVYKDGVQSVEINFSKQYIDDLPIRRNARAHLSLTAKGKTYDAGIRHTDRNKYIWISPNCFFEDEKVRLADLIFDLGFECNDLITLDFQGDAATILDR